MVSFQVSLKFSLYLLEMNRWKLRTGLGVIDEPVDVEEMLVVRIVIEKG